MNAPRSEDEDIDVVVIGAGMAGLNAASALSEAGQRVVVLDKGRRHGGRMATRRVDEATFDTGAIAFTALSPAFRTAVDGWVSAGHARGTPHTSDHAGAGMWRGVPTMRALPAAIADRLGTGPTGVRGQVEVRLATQVTGLARDPQGWRISFTHAAPPGSGIGAGPTARAIMAGAVVADAVVLTAPAPQALALLGPAGRAASAETLALLQSVVYAPALTVLVRPTDRMLPPDGLPVAPQVGSGTVAPDVARIHDNGRSGASAVAALTLQATPSFSLARLDGDRAAAAATLTEQASASLRVPLDVVHVHGWRFAQIVTGLDLGDSPPALLDTTSGAPLVIAGDLFAPAGRDAGPASVATSPLGVERAFLSGAAVADLLLEGATADR